MSTSSIEPKRTGRRRLRFSIGVLCLIIAAFALALGWMTNEARRQRRAIETIERFGGKYYFDYEFAGGDTRNPRVPNPKPPGPAWLRRWVGDELFRDVAWVELWGDRLRDDDLALLDDLPRLQEVECFRITSITEAGLVHLRGHPRLRKLHVSMAGEIIGDAAMAQIGNLDALEVLSLPDSRITNAGLEHLARLKGLRVLEIKGSRITDTGAAHLRGLKSLRELSLRASQITDAGVEHFLSLKDLRGIDLSASQITNAGLVRLGTLPKLARVIVEYTETSKKGVVAMKKIAPGVVVQTLPNDAGSIDASL